MFVSIHRLAPFHTRPAFSNRILQQRTSLAASLSRINVAIFISIGDADADADAAK